jgi:FkbM family methyltransferase
MKNFSEKITQSSVLFIYGAGRFAEETLHVLVRNSLKPYAFLDHIDRQAELQGLKIFKPDEVQIGIRGKAVVILAIHNREADVAAIVKRLRSLNYAEIITPMDLYDDFGDQLGDRYWLTQKSFYSSHRDEIEAARDLFFDETSRDLFNAILQFRTDVGYEALPLPDLKRQYFPADLPFWDMPLRLMDCGAYDGDTIRTAISLGMQIDAVAAYEPDPVNFLKLVETASSGHLPNVTLWPCAVYSHTTQLRFSSGHGEASLLKEGGESMIQCVSLDESAPTFAPNLIKMDIEGAEPQALLGAQQTILRYHPTLAISIYHHPAHLWTLPLQIYEFAKVSNLNYKYALRLHGHNGFDTIFYAIPV